MSFKKTLRNSDQRGVGREITRERWGRVKLRNMYKGPMDKDSGVGTGFGSGGWTGQGIATVGGRVMGTTVTEQQ